MKKRFERRSNRRKNYLHDVHRHFDDGGGIRFRNILDAGASNLFWWKFHQNENNYWIGYKAPPPSGGRKSAAPLLRLRHVSHENKALKRDVLTFFMKFSPTLEPIIIGPPEARSIRIAKYFSSLIVNLKNFAHQILSKFHEKTSKSTSETRFWCFFIKLWSNLMCKFFINFSASIRKLLGLPASPVCLVTWFSQHLFWRYFFFLKKN